MQDQRISCGCGAVFVEDDGGKLRRVMPNWAGPGIVRYMPGDPCPSCDARLPSRCFNCGTVPAVRCCEFGASGTVRYEVYLTGDQFQRLRAVDEEWVGSEHYMDLAWFWAYEYRFHLRDASAGERVRVHRELLGAELALDGESAAHQQIIEGVVGVVGNG